MDGAAATAGRITEREARMSEQKWIIVDKAVPKGGGGESYRYRGKRWADTIKQAVPFTLWEDAVENLGHVIESGVAYQPVLCRVRPKRTDAKWIVVDKRFPKGDGYRYYGHMGWRATIAEAGPFDTQAEAFRARMERPCEWLPHLAVRRVRPSSRPRLDAVARERDLAMAALSVLEREVDVLTTTLTDVAVALTTQESESVFEAACRVVRERDCLRLTRTNRS